MTVNNTEAKSAIQSAVKNFSTANLSDQAISLFRTLGYNTDRQNPFEEKTYACFKDSFLDGESRFSEEKAFVREWKSVDLLFQISEEEAKGVKAGRFDNKEINSFIFFAVELTKSDCSRTALAQITREINKIFPMPVMIVFRYGEYLTLSVINRRLHKKDEQKDVLEKVTLIKDISVASPHRAHIEILFDLSFDELRRVHKFTNFVELHDAWRKTLDTSVLNKNFYNDVAVMFTKLIGGERKIGSKKMTEEGVLLLPGNTEDIVRKEFAVRLIGRLLFCWFLKKKTSPANIPLISDKILSEKAVEQASDYGYYHSVFEPLFFEVLNRKKDERPEYLRQNEWDQIPFLNGGLFEPHRYDFYDLNKLNTSVYLNTLKIPDKWCKELLGIFEHYHFTIEENTPVEIEISIDPEMLGRIFENLLAEINPETGETARKSTGSYYTPRQIVEYMTDESLKQYLCSKTGIDEQKISVLLSYQDEEADLTEKEKDKIIDASEQLKILDPACGSGAFPMGILQKMILILQKTDPDSRKWLKKLLANIPDPTAREMMRRKLEGEKDLWNYTRKLGVIRSSIYGADIQPIAAEISKLRFFLSLVVDEKIADSDPQGNRGILPLPNLEFKFVCANTLIGLPKGDVGLFESQDAIEKLKELHTAYFSSYDEEKQGIRNGFYEVQKQMTKHLLEWKEIKDSEMLMLAAWNPFSGDSCGWFDMEWMFGIKDGFDIVIGNPPYIRQEKIRDLKPSLKKAYQVYNGTSDIYTYFYESGYNFLRNKGILAFITSNKWMRAKYGEKLRKFFLENVSLSEIIDFGGKQVFDATVDTNILIFGKEKANSEHTIRIGKDLQGFENLEGLENMPQSALNADCFTFGNSEIQALKAKIEAKGTPLKEWDVKIYNGVKTGSNEAFIIDGKTKDALIKKDQKNIDLIKPILRGKDIVKYGYTFVDLWLIYIPWHFPLHEDKTIKKCSAKAEELFKTKYPMIYEYLLNYKDILLKRDKTEINIKCEWYVLQRPRVKTVGELKKNKIIWSEMTDKNCFSFDNSKIFVNQTCYYIPNGSKYILAILNSKLIYFYFSMLSSGLGTGAFRWIKQYVEKIPVPKISQQAQQPFITLVDYILFLKKIEHTLPTGKDQVMSSFFEQIIDGCVYELYFEESMKKSEKDILKYLDDLPAITPTESQDKTLARIKTVFTRLYDREHPVAQRLYYLDSVKEVRIIKGLEVHAS